MSDIANPDLFVCVSVGPGLVLTSPTFIRGRASHPAGPHDRLAETTINRAPHFWEMEVSTQFVQQFVFVVIDPLFVGYVVWSYICVFCLFIDFNSL